MTTAEEEPFKQELVGQAAKDDKAHPWRFCPIGKHYVRTHVLHIPPSKEHPAGQAVIRHEHCAENASHKDVLSFDEIHYISEKYFSDLPGPPTADVLIEYSDADRYDVLIRGWVYYWNNIFHPDIPLDPDFVKALMATESGFDPKTDNKINKKIHAHGLMQIRNETMKYLGDYHGELKDYLVHLTHDNLYDPSANICAGIRWLFRKKITASSKSGHSATWEEAVIDYKGYWDDVHAGKIPAGLVKLRSYYQRLSQA